MTEITWHPLFRTRVIWIQNEISDPLGILLIDIDRNQKSWFSDAQGMDIEIFETILRWLLCVNNAYTMKVSNDNINSHTVWDRHAWHNTGKCFGQKCLIHPFSLFITWFTYFILKILMDGMVWKMCLFLP